MSSDYEIKQIHAEISSIKTKIAALETELLRIVNGYGTSAQAGDTARCDVAYRSVDEKWCAPHYYNAWISEQYRNRSGTAVPALVVSGQPIVRQLRDTTLAILYNRCCDSAGYAYARTEIAQMFEERAAQPYPLPKC